MATPTRPIRTWLIFDGPLNDDGPEPELNFVTTDADDALEMALRGHGVKRQPGWMKEPCDCPRCKSSRGELPSES